MCGVSVCRCSALLLGHQDTVDHIHNGNRVLVQTEPRDCGDLVGCLSTHGPDGHGVGVGSLVLLQQLGLEGDVALAHKVLLHPLGRRLEVEHVILEDGLKAHRLLRKLCEGGRAESLSEGGVSGHEESIAGLGVGEVVDEPRSNACRETEAGCKISVEKCH